MMLFAAMPLGAASIIPQPLRVTPGDGAFTLRADTRIVSDAANRETATLLARWLAPATGFTLQTAANATDNAIVLAIDPSVTTDEGYVLDSTPQRVTIRARTAAGVFYGVETLRQLLPPAIFASSKQSAEWTIPALRIDDTPRFAWRGAHLDVVRHFMPKDFVLKYIDLIALHKLNTFHWHLTDDQGWRVEIRKYPRLTSAGGWRKETRLGHEHAPRGFDEQPHGGFYTQKEIREVVAYAKARHVNIVPEIEMPGHAQAAIAAYPELGVTGKPLEVWTEWGINPNIFNPNEHTIRFLQDVLTEVMDLFPSKFIHIGGDEAIKDAWKASPEVQARIKELGLKNEEELQSWFTHRMDEFLTAHGRRLVGWDEILEGGLAPGATVMSWRGVQGGIAAAKAGHDVVMAPGTHTYFDHYQSLDPTEPPAIGDYLPLEKVYDYDPIDPALTADEALHVLGTQAQIWTEYIASPGHVEYMAFPRLAALAEVAWTAKERKNYGDFLSRLPADLDRLNLLGVNFRRLDNPIALAAGFVLRSNTMAEGETVPDSAMNNRYECTGANASPHLQWSGAPAATRSFAMIMTDPAARNGDNFGHWAVYNIPPNVSEIPASAGANDGDIPAIGTQAFNDFLQRSYGGPCPPPGPPHVYHFTLYALDLPSIEDPPATSTPMTWRKLQAVMQGHIVGQATLNVLKAR